MANKESDVDEVTGEGHFDAAVRFQASRNPLVALEHYFKYLDYLRESQSVEIAKLTQALHEIAEIYSKMDNYEVGLKFIMAERSLYELVLSNVAHRTRGTQENADTKKAGPAPPHPMTKHAEDLVSIADLCLASGNVDTALRYARKAVTAESWAGIPASPDSKSAKAFERMFVESGRRQYADTLKRFKSTAEGDDQRECSDDRDDVEPVGRRRGAERLNKRRAGKRKRQLTRGRGRQLSSSEGDGEPRSGKLDPREPDPPVLQPAPKAEDDAAAKEREAESKEVQSAMARRRAARRRRHEARQEVGITARTIFGFNRKKFQQRVVVPVALLVFVVYFISRMPAFSQPI